jgi:hypothetical protein
MAWMQARAQRAGVAAAAACLEHREERARGGSAHLAGVVRVHGGDEDRQLVVLRVASAVPVAALEALKHCPQSAAEGRGNARVLCDGNACQRDDACRVCSHCGGHRVNAIRSCHEQRTIHAAAHQARQHRAAVARHHIHLAHWVSHSHLHARPVWLSALPARLMHAALLPHRPATLPYGLTRRLTGASHAPLEPHGA